MAGRYQRSQARRWRTLTRVGVPLLLALVSLTWAWVLGPDPTDEDPISGPSTPVSPGLDAISSPVPPQATLAVVGQDSVASAEGRSSGSTEGDAPGTNQEDAASAVSQDPQTEAYAEFELGERFLRRDSAGMDVRRLQGYLKSLGFEVPVDGRFDADTEDAVREFQEAEALTVDGLVGEETLAALDAALLWHEVQRGDTLWDLSRLYGTTVDVLQEINRMTGTDIRAGGSILVPRAGYGGFFSDRGTYTVRPGDTLSGIASRFDVSTQQLSRINGLRNANRLQVGQKLTVPDGGRLQEQQIFPLRWPLPTRGRISSDFGWRRDPFTGQGTEFHGGIDIAVPSGTPVYAAAAGVVVDAGWMGASGYAVIIDHGRGVQTSYSHNQRVLVEAGDTTARGQTIAISGSTGRSTGPHLDFRVRIDGELLDPVPYVDRP